MPAKKADAKGAKGKGGKAATKTNPSKSSGGAKAKKKKWSKGKVKDKVQRAVIYEGESAHQQALKDVVSMRMITPSTVSDRLKVNLSLARRTINELVESGAIKAVSKHSSCYLYTKA